MLNGPVPPRLILDCGVDAQACGVGEVDLSERGLRFTSRWQFSIGTQIAVSLAQEHPRLGTCRMTVEGIVVWCEPKPGQRHESTLLFLELPEELKPSLREFSHGLAAS